MKTKRVIIRNDRNEKLVGYLYQGSPKTLIIVCHGIESNNNPNDPALLKIILEYLFELRDRTGASVFSFDFSGFGESDGKMAYSLRQRDKEVKTVIDYFSKCYDDIVVYGFSFGGITAAIAAAKYPEVTKLIAINGFFTYKPSEIRKHTLFIFYYYALTHMYYWFELLFLWRNLQVKKITVPTLVIYSDKDSYVHPKQSINFYRKLVTKKKIVSFDSNDHAMLNEKFRLPREIASWMKEMGINI